MFCRAEHHGAAAVLGSVVSSGNNDHVCAVAFLGRVHRKHKFEVLSNPGGAARVEWRPFSRFAPVPEGAVAAAEDAFVGRAREDEGPSYLPGSIALDGRSLAFDQMTVFLRHISSSYSVPAGPVARMESSGEVMVEVEPERYELHVEKDGGGRWGSKAKVRCNIRVIYTRIVLPYELH